MDANGNDVWMQRAMMCGCKGQWCVDAKGNDVWMQRAMMCGCKGQ